MHPGLCRSIRRDSRLSRHFLRVMVHSFWRMWEVGSLTPGQLPRAHGGGGAPDGPVLTTAPATVTSSRGSPGGLGPGSRVSEGPPGGPATGGLQRAELAALSSPRLCPPSDSTHRPGAVLWPLAGRVTRVGSDLENRNPQRKGPQAQSGSQQQAALIGKDDSRSHLQQRRSFEWQ
jgi:hypothetical protein